MKRKKLFLSQWNSRKQRYDRFVAREVEGRIDSVVLQCDCPHNNPDIYVTEVALGRRVYKFWGNAPLSAGQKVVLHLFAEENWIAGIQVVDSRGKVTLRVQYSITANMEGGPDFR